MSPPARTTGSNLAVPSVVSRTGSEEFMDRPRPRQHPQLGPRLGIDPRQLQDRRPDHPRRDRLGERGGAGPVAVADDRPAADPTPGPEREVALRPVVAAGLAVDAGRAAELAQR